MNEMRDRALQILPDLQVQRCQASGEDKKVFDYICGFVEVWTGVDFTDVFRIIDLNFERCREPLIARADGENPVVLNNVFAKISAATRCLLSEARVRQDFTVRNLEFFLTFLDLIDNIRHCKLSSHGFYDYPEVDNPHMLVYGGQNLLHFIVKGESDSDFCRDLCQLASPGDIFLTTNYDILMDRALIRTGLWSPFDGYGEHHAFLQRDLPYVDKELLHSYMKPSQVLLLKLHGSLNWTQENWYGHPSGFSYWIDYSTLDERLQYLEDTTWAYLDNEYSPPEQDLAGFVPAVIPPLFIKDTGDKHRLFGKIFQRAVESLASCRSLVSIGYSFPASDENIIGLLHGCISEGLLDTLVLVNPDQGVHRHLRSRWGEAIRLQSVECRAEELDLYRSHVE